MDAAEAATEVQYQQAHVDETHVPQLIVVFILSLIISYGAVTLRLVSRHLSRTQLKWDDWTILLSLLFIIGFIAPQFVFLRFGLGRHEILVKDPTALRKVILSTGIIYIFGTFLFKVSALCLLGRIFPGRRYRWILWATGVFAATYTTIQIFGYLFACTPVSRSWSPTIAGRCIDTSKLFLACSSCNIATNFILVHLPMPQLWRLKITIAQKFQLTALFVLGNAVFIISLIRLTHFKEVSSLDPSYTGDTPILLSALEMAFGILCASVPTYRPLLRCMRYPGKLTIESKSTAKPSQASSALDSTRRTTFDEDRGNLYPFTKLEINFSGADHWASTLNMPMNSTMTIAKHDSKAEADFDLGANEIKVRTDLEQETM